MAALTLDENTDPQVFAKWLRARGARIFRMRWTKYAWCVTDDTALVLELQSMGLGPRRYERCGWSKDGRAEWEIVLPCNRVDGLYEAAAPLEGAIGY